jgi:circadian clock protein KaiC
MLGGAGLYRGSSVLFSGTAGTGKSSLAAHLARESCARGERCLYFAFEESQSQIVRNMASIGIDLRPWIKKGVLRFMAGRPTASGLEMHLALMHRAIRQFQPRMVIVDPISNLVDAGVLRDAMSMMMRLIDFLKTEQITAVLTSLTKGGDQREETEIGISSLIDTWLLLRAIELGGERNRGLYVLKSRGMAHSNQIREFLLTSHGIDLLDVYVGEQGVLTGSMRMSQEARDRAAENERVREADAKARASERRRRALAAQIAVLRADLEDEGDGAQRAATGEIDRLARRGEERADMSRSRKADAGKTTTNGRGGARTGARN